MRPRPKPLLGLVLGLLLGAVIVALLWQLGVAPPDRLILFGVIGVSIAVTELLLTQTTRRGKKRFVTVMVVAGLFGGVALTGVPETFGGTGSLSDGCNLEITSGYETVTPDDTEPFDPLDTTPTDTLMWTASTDEVLTNWDASLGILIGGIPVELFTAERANDEQANEWTGEESVADYLNRVEDETGLQLRGTFHIGAAIKADEDDCDMAGYIRVNAESAFATPLIVGLWALGAVLAVMIVWIAASVRGSVRESKASTYMAPATVDEAAAQEPDGDAAFAPPAAAVVAATEPGRETAATPPSGKRAEAAASDAGKTERVVEQQEVVRERTVYEAPPEDTAADAAPAYPVSNAYAPAGEPEPAPLDAEATGEPGQESDAELEAPPETEADVEATDDKATADTTPADASDDEEPRS